MVTTSSSCKCDLLTSEEVQNRKAIKKYESSIQKLDLQWLFDNQKAIEFSLLDQEELPLKHILGKLEIANPRHYKFVYYTFAGELYQSFLNKFSFLDDEQYQKSVQITAFIIAVKFSESCTDSQKICSRMFKIEPQKYKRMEAVFFKTFPFLLEPKEKDAIQ